MTFFLVRAASGNARRDLLQGGFTLVEVMVVLALLALLAGLAVPNLLRLYEGFERATERGRILDQVAGLGERAMLEGAGLVLLGSDPTDDGELPGRFSHYRKLRPDVAEGWWVVVAPPLVVHANGACLGAVVELGEGERHVAAGEVVELRAPHCRIGGVPTHKHFVLHGRGTSLTHARTSTLRFARVSPAGSA